MKGIIRSEYGGPERLRFDETEVPVAGEGKVLIKVHASSVNPYDWHLMRGEPYLVRMSDGLRRPKSHKLGIDVAGEVSAVGDGVTAFHVGDEVFGSGVGTFAEFAVSSHERIAKKPAVLTFEAAATLPCAGVTALMALRDKAKLQAGQSLLINGASGGVGTFAVQIGKEMGATVTGVCSTRNVELVKSIGADEVIDYTREDFSKRAQKFDVVLDTVGNRSLSDLRHALTKDGTLLLVAGTKGKWIRPLALMLKAVITSPFVHHKLLPVMANMTTSDLDELAGLFEAGKLAPVIDRTYPLSDCAQAIDYVEEGHARGKVVVTV